MKEIRKACCIGTGTMGSSISLALALGGMEVTMYGRKEASIDRGLASIDLFCKNLVEANYLSAQNMKSVKMNIKTTITLMEALEEADFVSEAVSEDLELKQNIFAEIEDIADEDTVLTSTTSGMDPNLISGKMKKKDRFLVAHFSNPAHLMPFVELVPCEKTSGEAIAYTKKTLEDCGLKPVPLDRYVPGFIFNRLQFALLREAMDLVDRGIVSAEDVDTAVTHGLGRRLAYTGPLRSADMGGLDVFSKIASYLLKDLCATSDVSDTLQRPVRNGNYGTKTGQGIFNWTPEEIERTGRKREKILIDFMLREEKERSR